VKCYDSIVIRSYYCFIVGNNMGAMGDTPKTLRPTTPAT